jgi:uncharacterized protein involved in exopolysaccharide biosynthesis
MNRDKDLNKTKEGSDMDNILRSENQDFDLMQVSDLISKYKILIISIIASFTLVSIFYSLSLEKYYKSNILIVPTNESQETSSIASLLGSMSVGSSGKFRLDSSGYDSQISLSILQSRSFLESYVEEKNLLPVLFKDEWNSEENEWLTDEPPTLLDGYDAILDSLTIDIDGSLITITVQWRESELTSQLANGLIKRINKHLQNEAIEEGNESIFYLEGEINKTNLSSAKQMLYRLVEQQTQKNMLAVVREEYAFKVIDPARKPIHPSGPNRRLIVSIGFMIGVLSSVFLALLYHYLRNTKKVTH